MTRKKKEEEGAKKPSKKRIKENNQRQRAEMQGLQTTQVGGRPFRLVQAPPLYEELHPVDTYLQLLISS